MTPPVTTEALVEALAQHLAEAHVRGTDREDDFDWSAVTDQAFRASFIRAARRIFGGPLAPLLAAHQQVTAERDADRAEHARYRASAEEMWETAKRHGGRMLAEKRRADVAEASLATASAELARLRAEGEALKGALKQISDACPVTCDMSVAHDMAATAEHALARAATAREG